MVVRSQSLHKISTHWHIFTYNFLPYPLEKLKIFRKRAILVVDIIIIYTHTHTHTQKTKLFVLARPSVKDERGANKRNNSK